MAAANPTSDRFLIEHALLVGLAALIPVPLLDDLVRDAMRRRLVRAVLRAEGLTAGEPVVSALATEPGRGCLIGCPLALIVYPLKKIFRKIFYFLEMKRAVDLTSTSWHFAWLLQGLLRDRRQAPADAAAAAAWRLAIMGTLGNVGVTPVERVFRGVFRRSTSLLRGLADRLVSVLRGTRRTPDGVEAAVSSVEAEERAAMGSLVEELLRAIDALPADHFERLRSDLRRRMA